MIDAAGQRRTLSKGWLSIQGAAWSRDGREIWFTATKAGGLRALWAVTLTGIERLVYRAPQRMTLEDIAPDGRVLLSGTTMRSETIFGSISEKVQRKLTWFDWANDLSLSSDARLLAFTESGEGSGERYGVYLRPTDGAPAIRLADGSTEAISPDGKWVAAFKNDQTTLQLLPTGAGAAQMPNVAPLETVINARWFPDSQRLVAHRTRKGQEGPLVRAEHRRRRTEADHAGRHRRTLVSPDGEMAGRHDW